MNSLFLFSAGKTVSLSPVNFDVSTMASGPLDVAGWIPKPGKFAASLIATFFSQAMFLLPLYVGLVG